MLSVLALGFLIGLQHALEADHVAAVASLAARDTSLRGVTRHGAVWAIGHGLTLLVFGGAVLFLGGEVPRELAFWLEAAVGALLVLLGLDLWRRLIRDRIHFHRHRHQDGVIHIHAHAHAGEPGPHDPSVHRHEHSACVPLRSLLVGMMHGLAGSAALLILALGAVQSPWWGLLYIVIFALGSIFGMAVLSAVMAVPLSYSAKTLTWAHHGLQGAIGGITILVGSLMIAGGVAPL